MTSTTQPEQSASPPTEKIVSRIVTNKTLGDLPIPLRLGGSPHKLSAGETHEFEPGEVDPEVLAQLAVDGKIKLEIQKERFEVFNLTPHRIAMSRKGMAPGENQNLVIPAFGRREIGEKARVEFEVDRWENANLVKVESTDKKGGKDLGARFILVVGFVVGGLIALRVVLGEALKDHPNTQWLIWVREHYVTGACIIAILAAILVLVFGTKEQRQRSYQSFIGFVTLLIGIGAPAAIIFWDEVRLSKWSVTGSLAMGVQFTVIGIASIMPAALFFLFDRQRLRTLRETFFRDVTRLDPQVKSLSDAESIYGARVSETYGDPDSAQGSRIITSKRGPVIIATVLITAGWLLALRVGKSSSGTDPMDLFLPNPTPMAFGFLGAYFFGLNMLFRRYVRSDLKPKAYSNLAVRILTVTTLCWVLALLPEPLSRVGSDTKKVEAQLSATNNSTSALAEPAMHSFQLRPQNGTFGWILMFAFIAGIFPQTGLKLIVEALREWKIFRTATPSLHEKQALSDLEGVSLYERTRLLEEGIESIENLAHHDLIELVMNTRIPVPRLVDWLDQAILYLHLGVEDAKENAKAQKNAAKSTKGDSKPREGDTKFAETDSKPGEGDSKSDRDKGRRNLQVLRQHGIRTATDLERAFKAIDDKKKNDFLKLIDEPNAKLPRLEVVLAAIAGEQWMTNIRCWRWHGALAGETIELENLPEPEIQPPPLQTQGYQGRRQG